LELLLRTCIEHWWVAGWATRNTRMRRGCHLRSCCPRSQEHGGEGIAH
jgi:hypothetical protein